MSDNVRKTIPTFTISQAKDFGQRRRRGNQKEERIDVCVLSVIVTDDTASSVFMRKDTPGKGKYISFAREK